MRILAWIKNHIKIQNGINEYYNSAIRYLGILILMMFPCHLFPGISQTHWGRVTQICACNLIIIGSDNGLSPGQRQAITWTNARISLIGLLGTNLSEMLIEIHTFSLKKIHLKMSSGKWRPFCLGLSVIKQHQTNTEREHGAVGWEPKIYNFLSLSLVHIDSSIKYICACFWPL